MKEKGREAKMIKLYKKHSLASLIIILLVIMTVVAMVNMTNIASASPSPDTCIYVTPSEVRGVAINNTFAVNISVTEAPPTYAWEFRLSWNNSLLELVEHWNPKPFGGGPKMVNVTEGDFLDRHYWSEDFNMWVKNRSTTLGATPLDEANADGEILVGCTLQGAAEMLGSDGRRWMAKLVFNVTATGSCVLNLHKTQLLITNGWTYCRNEDGFFTNVNVHDVAVTSVTANTTSVVPGQAVNITVTAENEGNFSETFDVAVYADATVYNTKVAWWPDEIVVGDEITIDTYSVTSLGTGATNTTTNIIWSTTGVAAETYYISANVTLTSPDDDDPRDNMFIDDKVKFIVDHDLKIADVTVLTPIVIKGELANMTVDVLNQGTSSESFTLYVNASDTTIYTNSTSLSAGANSTFNISWSTTGVAGGTYTISAYLSPVSGEREVDKADNLLIDGTVKVEVHDLNVTDVTVFTPSVYEKWSANMSVTVVNEGTEREEYLLYVTANVTKPANYSVYVHFGSLAAGASCTYTNISWGTTGVVWGMYNISAEVLVVPGETDTADNILSDVWVHVMIPGDIDGDGDVDSTDLGILAGKYGTQE